MQRNVESKKQSVAVDLTGDGGIMKTILQEGSGEVIPNGTKAKVHYRGTLQDGSVFDTSRTRGQPFKFTVGAREVILGWDKGVATMKKGEICMLRCAPDYAYGNNNVGPIPANSTLDFEVELLDWSVNTGNESSTSVSFLAFVVVCGLIYFFLMK